mgnify:CR=1 FL=1
METAGTVATGIIAMLVLILAVFTIMLPITVYAIYSRCRILVGLQEDILKVSLDMAKQQRIANQILAEMANVELVHK